MTTSLTPVPVDDSKQRQIILIVTLIAIVIDGAAEPATGGMLSRAARAFGNGEALEPWLKVGFSVAYDLSILCSLWLISNHGKRGYFRGSLLGYGIACVAGAIAPTAEVLAGARIMQGACLGGLFACALLTMVGVSKPQRLPLVFALFTVLALAAPELAPLASALIAGADGWRLVFVALAVLPIASGFVASALMKDVEAPQAREFDTASFLAVALALLSFHALTENVSKRSFAGAPLVATVVLLVLSVAWFVLREVRFARAPFVDLRPLHSRLIAQGLSGCVLLGIVLGGSVALVTFGIRVGHFGALQSVMVSSTAFIGAAIGTLLVYRIWTAKLLSNQRTTVAGLVLLALAFGAQAAFAHSGALTPVVAALLAIVEGFALALTIGPLASLLFDGVPHEQFGPLALLFKIALIAGSALSIPLLSLVGDFAVLWIVFGVVCAAVAGLIATAPA